MLLKNHIVPQNIKPDTADFDLFDETVLLEVKNLDATMQQMIKVFGKQVFTTIYYCFLSEHEYKELLIYYFLAHYLTYGHDIYVMRNLTSVHEVLKISQYVSRENHKLKGFLRFKELENHVLYAEMAPVNNIIGLLSKHFKRRLSQEFWIIKDTKRQIISVYDKKNFYIVNADSFDLFPLNESLEERDYQKLWLRFYQTIGIKERANSRCRRNFMPKKYWQYILEVKDEL